MTDKEQELAKRRATAISLATNVSLTILKLSVAGLSHSVGIFSEAAHSATDIIGSVLAFVSVRAAATPPDEEHPYGHGKLESVSGFGESIMLGVIVAVIVFESVPRLLHPQSISLAGLALATMGVSSALSLVAGLYVSHVGKVTGSVALRANGRHLTIDFATSIGVLAAIAISSSTGYQQSDPIVALLLAAWVAFSAVRMGRDAMEQLIDRRIPDEDLQIIKSSIESDERILSYHKLTTRHSGSMHYIELHIVVPREYSVVQAHDVADSLEKGIESKLAPAHVVIHVDPFDPGRIT